MLIKTSRLALEISIFGYLSSKHTCGSGRKTLPSNEVSKTIQTSLSQFPDLSRSFLKCYFQVTNDV